MNRFTKFIAFCVSANLVEVWLNIWMFENPPYNSLWRSQHHSESPSYPDQESKDPRWLEVMPIASNLSNLFNNFLQPCSPSLSGNVHRRQRIADADIPRSKFIQRWGHRFIYKETPYYINIYEYIKTTLEIKVALPRRILQTTGWVALFPLDCYDYQTTCSAKNMINLSTVRTTSINDDKM